ncbi:MAG TPA: hypothetical protein VNF91_08290, partial [Candidatus Acidoferrum sp.]|nr:hypothetical protein [Candidatus Acidoferrum sp.]
QRVMRTRPRFPSGWRCAFEITLMPSAGVNVEDVRQALTVAGALSGLGDFRPRYGRFKVTGFEALS